MIYLDASALVTVVVERQHARQLRLFLADHAEDITCTSTIGFIETVRTCDQIGSLPNLLATLLRDHNEIKVSDTIREGAARMPGLVRALDAVYVASAEQLEAELTALVTCDGRMAEAARKSGLPVAMPGAE